MGVHGHTKIELTDVTTGAKECYEEHNLVTNAMYHLINDLNYLQMDKLCSFENFINNDNTFSVIRPYDDTTSEYTVLYASSSMVAIQNLVTWCLRGIKLFSTTIEESRNHLYPNSNEYKNIIGYGTYNASAIGRVTDDKRGAFNADESGPLTNGYRFVWDFDSSEANGTIKAVCLTDSFSGAQTASQAFRLSVGTTDSFYSADSSKTYGDKAYKHPVDYTDGILTCICFDESGVDVPTNQYVSNVIVRKYQFDTDSWTPAGCRIRKPSLLSTTKKTVTSSRYYSNAECINLANDGTYYYILARSTSANSGEMDYLIRIAKSDNSVSEIPLSAPFTCPTYSSLIYRGSYIYAIMPDEWVLRVKKISLIDYSIIDVGAIGDYYYTSTDRYLIYPACYVIDDVIYTPMGVILDDDTIISDEYVFGNNKYAARMHGTACLRKSNTIIFPQLTTDFNYGSSDSVNQQVEYLQANIQTGWLATINNLETPVIKNDTKTMKITYTLTWS